MKGWVKLYEPIIKAIEAADAQVFELKEKFGELRIYFGGTHGEESVFTPVLSMAVDRATSISRGVCIECGKCNRDVHMCTDGWVLPLCKECAIEQGREKGWEEGKFEGVILTTYYEIEKEKKDG